MSAFVFVIPNGFSSFQVPLDVYTRELTTRDCKIGELEAQLVSVVLLDHLQ